MDRNKQEITLADIIVEIKSIFIILLNQWKVMLIIGFLGGALGFIYASTRSAVYTSYLSFMLNENEQGIPTSLSSLAGFAGLGGGGVSSDDKILFMAGSRHIMANTLLAEVTIDGKKQLLANRFIDVYKMQDGFKGDTSLKGFTYIKNTNESQLTYQENKVIDKIIHMINSGKMLVITSKKKSGLVAQGAGIILFQFSSVSEGLSYHFVNILYDRLSNYYVNKTVHRQLKNYNLIKARADSLKSVVASKEGEGAAFIDQNTNLAKMSVRVSGERIRKDLEILNLMYAEVLKNLEVAKFTLESQTPSLALIDSPTIPLEIKKLSRMKSAIIGSVVMDFLTAIYLVFRKKIKIENL